jgi:hypothetical protein
MEKKSSTDRPSYRAPTVDDLWGEAGGGSSGRRVGSGRKVDDVTATTSDWLGQESASAIDPHHT